MDIYDESGVIVARSAHPLECDQIDRPADVVADCELLFLVIAPAFHGHLTNVLRYVQGLENVIGAGCE